MAFFCFLFTISTLLVLQASIYDAYKPLEFTSQPTSKWVKPGRKVNFRCATNHKDVHIDWLLNGRPLPSDHRLKVDQAAGRLRIHLPTLPKQLLGYSWSQLRAATFQCIARNDNESLLSKPARVLVAEMDDFKQSDLPVEHHMEVPLGSMAVIPCSLPYGAPIVVSEFIINDSTRIDRSDNRRLLMPSGALHIVNVQRTDAGFYRCVAVNPYLELQHNSSVVWVLKIAAYNSLNHPSRDDSFELRFLAKPPLLIEEVRGTNVTLECAADKLSSSALSWRRADRQPIEGSHVQILGGSLRLLNIMLAHEGIYVCTAQDSNGRSIETRTHVRVKEAPHLLRPLFPLKFDQNSPITFDCRSDGGRPIPSTTWYFNGQPLTSHLLSQLNARLEHDGSILYIKSAQPNLHEGIFQCFVTNELATVDSAARVRMRRAEDFDSAVISTMNNPSAKPNIYPPGEPNVTRITQDSVMLRWAPASSSSNMIQVSFYKLQYRLNKKGKKTIWQTLDEEIAPHLTSYSIGSLQPNNHYKFRVMAVFSNHEHKEGPTSSRFFLEKHAGLQKPVQVPRLLETKPISSSAVEVHWAMDGPIKPSGSVEGYFIHYRPAQSAISFEKVSVEGEHVRQYVISHLKPAQQYEIKIQSFNSAGGSSFSRPEIVRTLADSAVDEDEEDRASLDEDDDYSLSSNGVSSPSSILSNITSTSTTTTSTTTTTEKPLQSSTTQATHQWNLSSSTPFAPFENPKFMRPEVGSNDLSNEQDVHRGSTNFDFNNNRLDIASNEFGIGSNFATPNVHTDQGVEDELVTIGTLNGDFLKQLIPIVAIAASALLTLICCILQCRRSLAAKRIRRTGGDEEMRKKQDLLYGTLRGHSISPVEPAIVPASVPLMGPFGGSRHALNRAAALNGSRIGNGALVPGFHPQGSMRHITHTGTLGRNGLYGTVGQAGKPLLSHTVATLDRHRQRIRQFEDHYSTGQQFATINRSNSFARLNGTLERKRRSRPDLFSVMDLKEGANNTAMHQTNVWPAPVNKQPIYGESKFTYSIQEESMEERPNQS